MLVNLDLSFVRNDRPPSWHTSKAPRMAEARYQPVSFIQTAVTLRELSGELESRKNWIRMCVSCTTRGVPYASNDNVWIGLCLRYLGKGVCPVS